MNSKINYIAPAIEVIELEIGTEVMTHSVDTLDATEKNGGQFDARKRGFWE